MGSVGRNAVFLGRAPVAAIAALLLAIAARAAAADLETDSGRYEQWRPDHRLGVAPLKAVIVSTEGGRLSRAAGVRIVRSAGLRGNATRHWHPRRNCGYASQYTPVFAD